ncbi:MAG: hypothetical protein IJD88_08225, partial [Clostridia bacterium]|nr:hypothetical protein [Clostridia bacterium]
RHYEYESEYTAIEIKATTCTEDGIISYVNELGDSYTEIVSALGHKYELLRRVEPTCTKKGTEVHKCKTCNKINTIQINVTEHTYGVDGLCTVCDKIRDIATPENATTIIDREKNLISGLCEYLDADSLMNYITVSGDASVEIDKDAIGTGTKIKVIDKATSEIIEEYTIVIFGDYNGDGVADIEDTGYFASISNFEIFDYFEHEHLFMAADVNGDGVVDTMDEEDMYAVANFEAYIDHTITEGSKVVRY